MSNKRNISNKMDTYTVTFKPTDTVIQVSEGVTIMEAARQAGLELEAPCNGKGTCGKCKVKIIKPDQSMEDKLGCQEKVKENIQVQLFANEGRTFRTIETGRKGNSLLQELQIKPREEIMNNAKSSCYGIALDIGTTSIVAWLYDLRTGEQKGKASCLNPQTQYGGDVITRITYAKEDEGLYDLQRAVIRGINDLISKLKAQVNLESKEIYYMVVAANTTMLHLLKGVNPASLAVAPYIPIFLEPLQVSAKELSLDINEQAIIQFTPSSSAYVGGDILAGLLATDFISFKGAALFIDIGTNGELAVIKDGQIMATSTAAGPALEGMNITYGCRAEQGAIEGVKIDEQGIIALEVIGNENVKGLCGSGIIEATSELLRLGVILPNGRFAKSEDLCLELGQRLIKWQGSNAFLLDEASGVVLTQKDIRQIQLAKGAILAGINMVAKELGLAFAEIDKVYIAGAFGYHLKPEALVAIGLIPPELLDKIEFVGNTAIEGAAMALLNKNALARLCVLQTEVVVKELSFQTDFQDAFVKALSFPIRS